HPGQHQQPKFKVKSQPWICHYCGEKGHIRPFCFKLASSKEDWYFDSGCSKHMTGVENFLVDLKSYSTSFVTFGDGAKDEVLMRGVRSKDNCYLWVPIETTYSSTCLRTKVMMESINVVIDDSTINKVTYVETDVGASDQQLDVSIDSESNYEVSNFEPDNVPTNKGPSIRVHKNHPKELIIRISDQGEENFGQAVKHAKTLAVKMPIDFVSLLRSVILNQHPGIQLNSDVPSTRKSPLTVHYRLFEGTHVPDIVATSGKQTSDSMSRKDVIVKLKNTCKVLDKKSTCRE
ncbi:gag-protease polyprotein, partial [Trifolium pratense]